MESLFVAFRDVLNTLLAPRNSRNILLVVEWYKKTRAVPILYEWVVECISQYRLISFYRYLQELSRQDVRKLGYPEFLFEEDADEDSDSACNVST